MKKIVEVESPYQKEENEKLKTMVADLKKQLTDQSPQIKIEKVEVPVKQRLTKEIWVLGGLLAIEGAVLVAWTIKRKAKKKST